jgi:divalent metal cation (Fe/Co/Zn/Cd) transporter
MRLFRIWKEKDKLMQATSGPAIKGQFYQRALVLAKITIFYNLLEGIVSVSFGMEDETLSLFGFGIDSFVEVISGIGIWHMIRRIKHQPADSPDAFERRALQITGSALYLLDLGLVLTSAVNLYSGHRPKTTFWGVVISLVSIATMWALIHFKMKVGRQLNSDAIIADAGCAKTCLYLSFVLLAASAGYEITGIGGLDSLGAIAIAVFAYREGREAFEKAQGKLCLCCCQ